MKAGADLTATDKFERTAVSIAASCATGNGAAALQFLLANAKFDVNAVDRDASGFFPLLYAVRTSVMSCRVL